MGILAVILGILAIACAVLGTFMFGTIGGIAAEVLAAAAVVLGILKRKKDRKGGIASIVIGALAIILTVVMMDVSSNIFKTLHEKAVELKPDGLWAQVSEDVHGGMMELASRLPKDQASLDALLKEMQELEQMSGN